MRTQNEIQKEITTLKALKPVGAFKEKTASSIKLILEELEHGFDDTADEWNELTDGQRDTIMVTRAWKEGDSNDAPSASHP